MDIEAQDHARGCEGRNYACTCGYDDRVISELSLLRSENERMRKALEPFATSDMLGNLDSCRADDDSCVCGVCDFTYGDLDAARAALNEGSQS
jgi:hypothetical protein